MIQCQQPIHTCISATVLALQRPRAVTAPPVSDQTHSFLGGARLQAEMGRESFHDGELKARTKSGTHTGCRSLLG
jgi:hypothetical protein